MTIMLTIDMATRFEMPVAIPGHGRAKLTIYPSVDLKNATWWLVRGTNDSTYHMVTLRIKGGVRRWGDSYSDGDLEHFATAQDALDAALEAGAVPR